MGGDEMRKMHKRLRNSDTSRYKDMDKGGLKRGGGDVTIKDIRVRINED